jgi:F0F1-type ATP synthase assembly protein I
MIMKTELLVQFVASILLLIASIGLLFGAFINDSPMFYRVFVAMLFLFSIAFVRNCRKEMKQ